MGEIKSLTGHCKVYVERLWETKCRIEGGTLSPGNLQTQHDLFTNFYNDLALGRATPSRRLCHLWLSLESCPDLISIFIFLEQNFLSMDQALSGQGGVSEMHFTHSPWVIGRTLICLLSEPRVCRPHVKQHLPARHQPQRVVIHNFMSRQCGEISPSSLGAGFKEQLWSIGNVFKSPALSIGVIHCVHSGEQPLWGT